MNSLVKQTNIVKYKELEGYFGDNFTLYTIWDINKKSFNYDFVFYDEKVPKLTRGVYTSSKAAIIAAVKLNLKKYKIVDICFKDKIPDDLIRVMQLEAVHEHLVIGKLNQLVKLYIFWNDKLKDSLINTYG
jgi:hypothetical protein